MTSPQIAPLQTPSAQDAADARVTWHALDAEDVLVRLATRGQTGLSSDEAAARLQRYGRNELQEKPRPGFWHLVLAQLNNFVIILLIVAAVVSALLGDWVEAAAILLIVVCLPAVSKKREEAFVEEE